MKYLTPYHEINYTIVRQVEQFLSQIVDDKDKKKLEKVFRYNEINNPSMIEAFGMLYHYDNKPDRIEHLYLYQEFLKLYDVILLLIRDAIANDGFVEICSINYNSLIQYVLSGIDNGTIIYHDDDDLIIDNDDIENIKNFLFDWMIYKIDPEDVD